jgi:hypothetical protein
LVHIGARLTAVLPDRVIELGTVKPEFTLLRERDLSGKIVALRVRPD